MPPGFNQGIEDQRNRRAWSVSTSGNGHVAKLGPLAEKRRLDVDAGKGFRKIIVGPICLRAGGGIDLLEELEPAFEVRSTGVVVSFQQLDASEDHA